MKSLEETNGPWGGFWTQYGQRGTMKFNMEFRESSIYGSGTDRSGSFNFEGDYSNSDRVNLIKTYDPMSVIANLACPEIRYRGKWNGQYISGTWWQVGYPNNKGEIELWPLGSEESLEKFMREEALSHQY